MCVIVSDKQPWYESADPQRVCKRTFPCHTSTWLCPGSRENNNIKGKSISSLSCVILSPSCIGVIKNLPQNPKDLRLSECVVSQLTLLCKAFK